MSLSVFAPTAYADCSGLRCDAIYIETLYADSGELGSDIWLQTSGNESALNCTPNSGVWLKLRGSAESKKEVYALLSMAFAMDKPVTIRVVENSQDCLIAYAYLTR